MAPNSSIIHAKTIETIEMQDEQINKKRWKIFSPIYVKPDLLSKAVFSHRLKKVYLHIILKQLNQGEKTKDSELNLYLL